MVKDKKRERSASDIVSPPHKMSKSTNESHLELMARLDRMEKNFEKRFDIVDKLLKEVDKLDQGQI